MRCVLYLRLEFLHTEIFNPFLVRRMLTLCNRQFFCYKEVATPSFLGKKTGEICERFKLII